METSQAKTDDAASPSPSPDGGKGLGAVPCSTVERRLSAVYHWIERNHPDGFIDSQSYTQNLDRVADRLFGKIWDVEAENEKLRGMIRRAMEFGLNGSKRYSATEANQVGDEMKAYLSNVKVCEPEGAK